MDVNVTKVNEANVVVTANIDKSILSNALDRMAKQVAKTANIQGFRKGKAPISIIKTRYSEKLTQDAQNEAVKKVFDAALEKLKINNKDLIGEPLVSKFDKKDNGDIEVELKIFCKPKIDLGDYKALLPEIKTKKVTIKEVDERIKQIALKDAKLEKIKRKRSVKKGDFAIIDFEGFKDGVAFDGGKAQKYPLEIGSNSFVPGFEEQIIGMKYEEEKDISITFPDNYQAKDLAGAKVVFKVKLHEIQTKVLPTIDDEFAKKILPQEKNATVDILKERIKEQIKNEKTQQYYNNELRPAYLESLIEKLDFAIPQSILDQEINQILNNKIRAMSEKEIKELQNNFDRVESMKEEVTPEAIKSVKATFIIDALAKAQNIKVTDQEVTQAIYYEAAMNGQDGKSIVKQYEEQGYLPVIKMSMLEQKVINKLLDEKAGK
jgi:trigger factor